MDKPGKKNLSSSSFCTVGLGFLFHRAAEGPQVDFITLPELFLFMGRCLTVDLCGGTEAGFSYTATLVTSCLKIKFDQ